MELLRTCASFVDGLPGARTHNDFPAHERSRSLAAHRRPRFANSLPGLHLRPAAWRAARSRSSRITTWRRRSSRATWSSCTATAIARCPSRSISRRETAAAGRRAPCCSRSTMRARVSGRSHCRCCGRSTREPCCSRPTYWMTTPAQPETTCSCRGRKCARASSPAWSTCSRTRTGMHWSPLRRSSSTSRTREALARFDIYDWPMRDLDGVEELGRPAPGTPIYRSMPLLSAHAALRRERRAHAGLSRVRAAQRRRRSSSRSPTGGSGSLTSIAASASACADGSWTSRRSSALVASEFELSREQFRKHLACPPTQHRVSVDARLAPFAGARQAVTACAPHSASRSTIAPSGAARACRSRYSAVSSATGCNSCRARQRSNVLAAVGRKLSGIAKLQHLAH